MSKAPLQPRLGSSFLTAVGVLLVAVVFSTACGKSTQKSAATTTRDNVTATSVAGSHGSNASGACKLVTSAELEKAAGASLLTGTPRTVPLQNGLGLEMCQWTNGKQGAATGVYTYAGGITSALFTEFRHEQSSKYDTTTVDGVGDEAFEIMTNPVGSKTDQIYFRKGSKAALVELTMATETTNADLQQRVLDLSKAAAGRL